MFLSLDRDRLEKVGIRDYDYVGDDLVKTFPNEIEYIKLDRDRLGASWDNLSYDYVESS